MSGFDVCISIAVVVSILYGWLVQWQWFANHSQLSKLSDTMREWLLNHLFTGLLLLLLSSKLALLALALTFFFEYGHGPGGAMGFVLTLVCSLFTVCLFVLKGFMWSWLWRQILDMLGRRR